jgi:SAM-dependent methyltransferase
MTSVSRHAPSDNTAPTRGKLAPGLPGAVALVVFLLGRAACVAQALEPEPADSVPTGRIPAAVFIPSPQDVVDKMLEVAGVRENDVVYDLGCGDGRIVVTAAKRYGCRAVGFDIDPLRVEDSNANVRKNGVGNLVTIEQKDIFGLELRDASVITLYLGTRFNERLLPQLRRLKPGSRIVSHQFGIPGVSPDKTVTVTSEEDGREHTIHLWRTPLFERTSEK